jgi:phosphatidylinositol alpha-1,6-mannosyltransferase
MLDEVPDMPSLLAASTALVMPVERTYAKMDLPLVVLEALHLGVPCILPAVGPLAELAEQGTGLAVDPSSPEELADAMLRFVREPSLGADLGRAALATWREHYSPARVAPRYEELYDELLGARGPMSHLEAGAT